jgi:hypothetical protein
VAWKKKLDATVLDAAGVEALQTTDRLSAYQIVSG